MSSVYNLEPPTKGKVVINTNLGPIDIELWPKEAPKTVRNFVQLCLEGYFDGTLFHRVIKSFLVQGGDPTSSGVGGESIYGGVFADEFHSRLRFNHRGIVASANAGAPNTNGSQFFMTLDRCDWLDRKNTIFGKVTGDSIYNLLQLGEVETDKNDRPLDPAPRILSVEVLWNPFDDIIPRKVPEKSSFISQVAEGPKKKAVKKLNLLSFGEEAEEEEKELTTIKEKIKSSHDVLNDPRLLKEESLEKEPNLADVKGKRDLQVSVREALRSKRDGDENESATIPSDTPDISDDDEANFDSRMRSQILQKRMELGDISRQQNVSLNKTSPKKRRSPSPRHRAEDSDVQRASKLEKLSMKKKGVGSEARTEQMFRADVDLQLLNQKEQERHLNKQKKRRLHGREDETLSRLEKFKKSFTSASTAPESEDDVSGWKATELKFVRDASKEDRMARTNDPNEYAVHDPLLEKGKEKFNRMQAKLKRREREWAGKSLT